MKTQQLLIATHNPAKKQELGGGFASLHIPLLYLDDVHITQDPEETGTTFLANAQLKSRFFAKLSHLPTVSDDGGIEIDALNGEPGVHSKRWLGRDATDAEMIAYTLEKLKGVPLEKRTAQFTVFLHYFNPLTQYETTVSESLKGHIAFSASGQARKGFPYRALFVVDQYSTFYDELTDEQHIMSNHRLRAVAKLIPFIKEDLLQ